LHGITGSSTTFEPIMTALAHTAHMYALDLRGHGLSDRADSPNGYRVPDFARDVQAFLEQVVGEPKAYASAESARMTK
jgi:pimeloyl-ACP methyl ester carboxylesterase